MKKINTILCCTAIVASLCSCSSKNNFTINGTVNDANSDGMKVYLIDTQNDNQVVDSTEVKDGTFCFKGSVDEPWLGAINCDLFAQKCIVEPGVINVTAETMGGTPLNDKLQEMNNQLDMADIEAQMQEYLPLYYSAPDAAQRAAAERVLDSLQEVGNNRIVEACWQLYADNRDNVLSEVAMENICQAAELTYSQLDSIVKAAEPRIGANKRVQRKLEQLRNVEATSEGKHYVDVQGVDGKLSDLIEGRVALVDFWASWCGPCRNEIKDNLVPLWEKYRNKGLVIVGLNVWERGDRAAREAAHQGAVEKLGITYPQLVDSTRTATDTYGVIGIPEIMLVDKDGTILARGLRGAAIEEAIKKAL